MPRANKGPYLVLYGPDNRFGASVRLGFSRYLWYSRGTSKGGDASTAMALSTAATLKGHSGLGSPRAPLPSGQPEARVIPLR